jgi:hypothetical protein
MAHGKKNTKRFKSTSTGQPCDAAQYAAELVCTRRRERENKGSLEYKFWNKSHKDQYQVQVRAARKLIKKFGEEPLIKYLIGPNGKSVYSLGFLHKSQKFVLSLTFVEVGVAKCADNLKKESKKEKKTIDVPESMVYKPRKSHKKNTLLSKLRNIENVKDKREET